MKREGSLYAQLLTIDTFNEAWLRARRGKADRPEVRQFGFNLDDNLWRLIESLDSGTFVFGRSRSFTIHDPKERTIHAAPFPERIVQHALMIVLDPIFESFQCDASYACRRGKGTQAAVLRSFSAAKSRNRFLKLDVRKYFDSIDHKILSTLFRRKIKDSAILALLDAIVDSYETSPGVGIPIGNLTSQYFANHYLALLDHYVLDTLRIGPGFGAVWIRYMDDMLCIADTAAELGHLAGMIRAFCSTQLNLILKPAASGLCAQGIPFLGYLVKPHGIWLARKSKIRFKKRYRRLLHDFSESQVDQEDFARRSCSMVAHLELARSRTFRQTVIHGRLLGYEPRPTRG